MGRLGQRLNGLYSYRNLLQQLVERDVKLKYRRSFLGYLWSILNPLMIMMIMVIVFSNMFRFDSLDSLQDYISKSMMVVRLYLISYQNQPIRQCGLSQAMHHC